MRRAFHSWMMRQPHADSLMLRRDKDGDYVLSFTQADWITWQAAWSAGKRSKVK